MKSWEQKEKEMTGTGLDVLVEALNLALLAGAVFVIVWVLRAMGVIQ